MISPDVGNSFPLSAHIGDNMEKNLSKFIKFYDAVNHVFERMKG